DPAGEGTTPVRARRARRSARRAGARTLAPGGVGRHVLRDGLGLAREGRAGRGALLRAQVRARVPGVAGGTDPGGTLCGREREPRSARIGRPCARATRRPGNDALILEAKGRGPSPHPPPLPRAGARGACAGPSVLELQDDRVVDGGVVVVGAVLL